MTSRTLYTKLVDAHAVTDLGEDTVLLFCDLHIMNEYTSPQAFAGLHETGREVLLPKQHVCTVDHVIPTAAVTPRVITERAPALQASNLKVNCDRHGIALYDTSDPLQGVEHVIVPESGMLLPGMSVLCGDSHTTSFGAFGALAFGIGTSEVEHVLATSTLVHQRAKNMHIIVDGHLPAGVVVKDLILKIIAQIGARGAVGYAIEYSGSAIDDLSVEARLTLCNMSVEAGARTALIAPDEKIFAYVAEHADLHGAEDAARADWAKLYSDPDAHFDVVHTFDAADVAPYVTWGTSPDQAAPITDVVPDPAECTSDFDRTVMTKALAYTKLESGTPLAQVAVDHVFIGSCTNGRIEDLRQAAAVAKGRQVAPGLQAIVVPGSGPVREQAEAEGLADIFLAAGFEWRKPGCSMCLAMNDDILPPGARCASTTNRNFEGRQGPGAITHLVSPAMAAAAAVTGRLTDVRDLEMENDR